MLITNKDSLANESNQTISYKNISSHNSNQIKLLNEAVLLIKSLFNLTNNKEMEALNLNSTIIERILNYINLTPNKIFLHTNVTEIDMVRKFFNGSISINNTNKTIINLLQINIFKIFRIINSSPNSSSESSRKANPSNKTILPSLKNHKNCTNSYLTHLISSENITNSTSFQNITSPPISLKKRRCTKTNKNTSLTPTPKKIKKARKTSNSTSNGVCGRPSEINLDLEELKKSFLEGKGNLGSLEEFYMACMEKCGAFCRNGECLGECGEVCGRRTEEEEMSRLDGISNGGKLLFNVD